MCLLQSLTGDSDSKVTELTKAVEELQRIVKQATQGM